MKRFQLQPEAEETPESCKTQKGLAMQTLIALTLVTSVLLLPSVQALASTTTTTSVVTSSFSSLQSLVASIVSSIGYIITLWGVSEFGISMQGAQGTMQAEAFKRIGGGLIMVLAPQILNIIT